jgi:hypothetical protein
MFDLGAPAVEVAIALAFVFLVLSLIATQLTEWIAYLLKLRSKNLKQGLEGMLGDQKVFAELLEHPLVRNDLLQGKRKRFSYISPRNFALALRDLIVGQEPAVPPGDLEPDLRKQLGALAEGGDVTVPDVPVVEKWFDESMQRVGGWYKRKAQVVTIVVATVLAVGLNASALRIGEQLAAEPNVRAALVAKAEAAAKEPPPKKPTPAAGESQVSAELKQAGEDMEKAVDKLVDLELPIFWVDENVPDTGEEIALAVIGWLLTIVAISLGAPFWFDALGKLSNLRLAGRRPEKPQAGAEGSG